MRLYLIEATYTPDTWRHMMENPDAFDGEWLRTTILRLGGELDGMWWTASGGDVVVICRLPSDICLAGLIAAFKANGTIVTANVKILLSVDDQMAALRMARGE